MARMSDDPHNEFSLSFARKFFMKIMGIDPWGAWQEHERESEFFY